MIARLIDHLDKALCRAPQTPHWEERKNECVAALLRALADEGPAVDEIQVRGHDSSVISLVVRVWQDPAHSASRAYLVDIRPTFKGKVSVQVATADSTDILRSVLANTFHDALLSRYDIQHGVARDATKVRKVKS